MNRLERKQARIRKQEAKIEAKRIKPNYHWLKTEKGTVTEYTPPIS